MLGHCCAILDLIDLLGAMMPHGGGIREIIAFEFHEWNEVEKIQRDPP